MNTLEKITVAIAITLPIFFVAWVTLKAAVEL